MIATLLLSALAVTAAPARRQVTGNTPGYLISFPTGNTGPYNAQNLCLAANPNGGNGVADGTAVGFVPCTSVQTQLPNEPNYGLWNIQYGNQQGIQLVGTNFCLDAGSNPGSQASTPGKVWTCLNVPQQQFYYTGDNHIAVTGSTPCLDSTTSGSANFVQCGSNTNNGDIQSFMATKVGGGGSSSSASSSTASSTASSSASSSTSSAPPSSTGRAIYWQNGNDVSQCLTVTNGQFYDGSPVGIAPCKGSANQMWTYTNPGVTSIQVAGQNYCIDFGNGGGSNGNGMKIWTCYPGLFQQTMYYTTDNHIAVYNGNQCLDVQAGTSNVQSWACSGPDVNQHWKSG